MLYYHERQEICETIKLMFDRKLTNAAGGNISYRIDDKVILMTPTLMARDRHCHISPAEIVVMDYELNKIEGIGGVTTEANMHAGILKNLPLAQAVIHAHPQNAMVFACLGLSIPSITEATDLYGEITTLPHAKSGSQELADHCVKYFTPRKDELKKNGLAVLLRRHGIVTVDTTLKKAFGIVERVETCAYVNLQARLLGLNLEAVVEK